MKTKRAAASSPRDRLVVKSEADIERYLKSPQFQKDSRHLGEHLAKHGGEPSPADLRAIPELTGQELAGMYRPVKRKISVRVDADVLAWLKSKNRNYQTSLNRTLREAMIEDLGIPGFLSR